MGSKNNPDLLSVQELKDIVIKMGYWPHMILEIYLGKQITGFEKALIAIESNENVDTLIGMSHLYPYIIQIMNI